MDIKHLTVSEKDPEVVCRITLGENSNPLTMSVSYQKVIEYWIINQADYLEQVSDSWKIEESADKMDSSDKK